MENPESLTATRIAASPGHLPVSGTIHRHSSGSTSFVMRDLGSSGRTCARSPAEKNFQDLIPSDHADEFVHGAVHQNQRDQDELDGPEMRPDDLREQFP